MDGNTAPYGMNELKLLGCLLFKKGTGLALNASRGSPWEICKSNLGFYNRPIKVNLVPLGSGTSSSINTSAFSITNLWILV